MGYGYQERRPRRRSWVNTCLGTLVLLIFLVIGLALLALYFVKPQLSQEAGAMLGGQLDQMISQRLEQEIDAATGQLPPGYAGTIVIPEGDINAYIAANPQEIAPLDSATVRFVPGEMVADISAYGVSGTARAGLAVVDGRLAVVNTSADGVLGLMIDIEALAGTIEDTLNARLDEAGVRIDGATVEQGQIVLSIADAR